MGRFSGQHEQLRYSMNGNRTELEQTFKKNIEHRTSKFQSSLLVI